MQNESLRQAQCALEALVDRYVDFRTAPTDAIGRGRDSAINLTGAACSALNGVSAGKRFRAVEIGD
jgi:hypothetical protein